MKKTIIAGLMMGLLSVGAFAGADLVVRVQGLNSAEGRVRVALYDQAKNFKKEKKAVTIQEAFASTNPVLVTIRDLPPGTYAVQVVHDKDGDGKFDHLIGLFPREGYGLSGNDDLAKDETFENSQFNHDGADVQEISVNMRYCGNQGEKPLGTTLNCWISLSP